MKVLYDRMIDRKDTQLTNVIVIQGKEVLRFNREFYSTQEFASEDQAFHFFNTGGYSKLLDVDSIKLQKEIIVFMFKERE